MTANQDKLDGMAETFALFFAALEKIEDALNTMTSIAYEQADITGQKPTDYSGMLAALDVLQGRFEMDYYRHRDALKNQIDIQNLDAPGHWCDQL